jgi:hypothetical protein
MVVAPPLITNQRRLLLDDSTNSHNHPINDHHNACTFNYMMICDAFQRHGPLDVDRYPAQFAKPNNSGPLV